MKRLRAFIFVKDGERGLLSLTEGRAKSLVPVFGGNRIIDTYVHPLIHAGLDRITVLTGGERPDIRDYFLYRYSSSSVEVDFSRDVIPFLSRSLAMKGGERALILQAEGLLLLEWKRLLQDLLDLPEGNYHLRTIKKETIGFFIAEGGAVSGKAAAEPSVSGIDDAWERSRKLLERGAKLVEHPAVLFPLRTVSEYFKGHFTILRRLEECVGFEQLHPVEEVDERSLSNVSASGSVKSSYIAHSCVVEGTVERSILFPHVRVGKGARISNSIVMDHNSVGGGALIVNSIVCDNNELFSRITPNIGDNVRIGEEGCSGANALYPELLNGGITMVGRNVEIPGRVTVSRNCYISSDTGKTCFRGKNKVEAGDSILAPEG
jgi:NDP-sugar pyrophosphorylase family protein